MKLRAPTPSPFVKTTARQVGAAGVGFDQVVRTWIYINQITAGGDGHQRYQELNRARTDFYRGIRFGAKARASWTPETIYPASTGIGCRNQDGAATNRVRVKATQRIRPDTVYMVYGFGHTNPRNRRAFGKGASAAQLNTRYATDPLMGGTSLQGNFVAIEQEA